MLLLLLAVKALKLLHTVLDPGDGVGDVLLGVSPGDAGVAALPWAGTCQAGRTVLSLH